MVVRGVRRRKQTVSPTRFLWSSPTAGVSSQLVKGRQWRDTRNFSLQISHVSWLHVDSHFSIHVRCTRPTDPEQEHGEINFSVSRSPSWQILQNTPEELLLLPAGDVLTRVPSQNAKDITGLGTSECERMSVETFASTSSCTDAKVALWRRPAVAGLIDELIPQGLKVEVTPKLGCSAPPMSHISPFPTERMSSDVLSAWRQLFCMAITARTH